VCVCMCVLHVMYIVLEQVLRKREDCARTGLARVDTVVNSSASEHRGGAIGQVSGYG
jgi:hypothetical protein